jgi:hypothetical protein
MVTMGDWSVTPAVRLFSWMANSPIRVVSFVRSSSFSRLRSSSPLSPLLVIVSSAVVVALCRWSSILAEVFASSTKKCRRG